MVNFTLSVTETIGPADLDVTIAGLVEYNRRSARSESYRELTVLAHDSSNQLLGALNGWTFIDALTISYLWVDEKLRRNGLGTKLVQAAEAKRSNGSADFRSSTRSHFKLQGSTKVWGMKFAQR